VQIGFLTPLTLYISLILLNQAFFLLDHQVFLLDDALQAFFILPELAYLLIFVAKGHLAMHLVAFELLDLPLERLHICLEPLTAILRSRQRIVEAPHLLTQLLQLVFSLIYLLLVAFRISLSLCSLVFFLLQLQVEFVDLLGSLLASASFFLHIFDLLVQTLDLFV